VSNEACVIGNSISSHGWRFLPADRSSRGYLRERKKEATRQALQVAALRLALDRGPENVRVDDIAEAAGVSPRTYNNYFSSREQVTGGTRTVDAMQKVLDGLLVVVVLRRPTTASRQEHLRRRFRGLCP